MEQLEGENVFFFSSIYIVLMSLQGGGAIKARRRGRTEACKLWMQTAISARAKKREALGETTSHAYQIILPLPLPLPHFY